MSNEPAVPYVLTLNGKTTVVESPDLAALKKYALEQSGFDARKAKASDVIAFNKTGGVVVTILPTTAAKE